MAYSISLFVVIIIGHITVAFFLLIILSSLYQLRNAGDTQFLRSCLSSFALWMFFPFLSIMEDKSPCSFDDAVKARIAYCQVLVCDHIIDNVLY